MAETLRAEILEHHRKSPDRLCVRCLLPDGSVVEVSYADLVSRGSQFSSEFRRFHADVGDIVVIILPHSPDLFCAFFGAVLGGQVPSILAVPSFKLHPAHYREELQALLERIDARVVVTDGATSSFLGLEKSRLGTSWILLSDKLPVAQASIPDVSIDPDDLVLLQHSSGSTGLKKGVALSNRAVLRQIRDYVPTLALGKEDHIVSWLPLYDQHGLYRLHGTASSSRCAGNRHQPSPLGNKTRIDVPSYLEISRHACLDAQLRVRIPGIEDPSFPTGGNTVGFNEGLDQLCRTDVGGVPS